MKSGTQQLALIASLICVSGGVFAADVPQVSENNAVQFRELQNVVVVSRHGVRAPTQSEKKLAEWSTKPWPQWGVEKGYLTDRGFSLIKQTWEFEGRSSPYVHGECPKPGDVQVLADIDERTIKTGEALVEGLYPGCGIKVIASKEKTSPLFNPLKNKVCKVTDPEGLAEKLTAKSKDIPIKFKDQIAEIGKITGVSFEGTIEGDVKKHKATLKGRPVDASKIAEIFALEWGQFPGQNVGWGEVNQSKLDGLMPFRVAVASAQNRDIEVAMYRGSALAAKILESLDKGPKYTFLIGHDTSLANLGAIFDLNWQLPGRAKNENTPGGFLTFEKWLVNGKPEIRVTFSALSPEQIHSEKVTMPPEEVEIVPFGTDYAQWKRKVGMHILEACVPQNLVKSR